MKKEIVQSPKPSRKDQLNPITSDCDGWLKKENQQNFFDWLEARKTRKCRSAIKSR